MSGGRTNIGGLEIDIRADGSGLIRDLKLAEAQAHAFGNKAAAGAMKAKTQGFDPLGRAVGDVRVQMVALASIAGLAGLANSAIKAADSFTAMRSRLGLVVQEGENLLAVEESLAKLALKNRADLEATVSLYSRLRTARKDLSDATTQKILDAWSKTLVISGANATEAASATLQFAQAMGSGVLMGAELSAVLENNSRASRLIADSLGVPIGALKKLGEQGELTTDKLIGIFTSAGALDGEFDRMAMTTNQAGTNFSTAFTRVIGLLDQSTGATKVLAGWIDSMAQSLMDFGVSLGGPMAQAEASLDKIAAAQNAVIADTDKLKGLHEKLSEAMAGQGEIAQNNARMEIDAVNQRIKANKSLVNVYRAQAAAQLSQAAGDLQAKMGGAGMYANGDPSGIDYQLLQAPLNEKGESVFSKFGYPAQQRGREAEIDSYFGDRSVRLRRASDQINRDIDADKPLSQSQQLIAKFNGEVADIEYRLKTAKQVFTDLNKAVADGVAYDPGGGAPGAVTGGGGGKDEKTDKLSKYTLALEDFNATINEIGNSNASAADKSRAVVQALVDYQNAAADVLEVLEKLQTLNEFGVLTDADAELARSVILAKDFADTVQPADMDDAGEAAAMDAATKAAYVAAFGFDPDGAQTDIPEDYFLALKERTKESVKGALNDAFRTGDYGEAFQTVIANALSEAFADTINSLVDALFEIPWGDILGGSGGGGGAGGLLGTLASAFGFGGARASGGPVSAGKAYRVGEMGAEMFVPTSNGTIIPNALGREQGGGVGDTRIVVGGSTVVINGNADAMTVKAFQSAMSERDRSLANAIDLRIRDRRKRGAY